MSVSDLWSSDEPIAVVAADEARLSLVSAFPQTGRFAVVHLDGVELPDDNSVFLAFYTSLQFPDYFGWNYNALSDCLEDLQWFVADRYLILIERADQLLSGEDHGSGVLLRVLTRAALRWANPMAIGGEETIPFAVVLLCDPEQVDRVAADVAAARSGAI